MIKQLLTVGLVVIPTMIPIGAIAGIPPTYAQNKLRAIGQASLMMCFVSKGKLSEAESLTIMMKNLKNAGIDYLYPWLETAEAKKAVQVARKFLRSDCQGVNDEDAMTKALMPYVL